MEALLTDDWPRDRKARKVPPAGITAVDRKPRVLVVDDDPDMRRLVVWRLRSDGYDVVEAADGVDLLRILQSSIWRDGPDPLDAIVSDIQMPDLTAFEVLGALPDREYGPPVVLMTAYGADRARPEGSALGAVAVLGKPLDWSKLRASVRRAVSLGAGRVELPLSARPDRGASAAGFPRHS
jgi:CheY-like chemotaxis protein